jgi:TRAP-type C4-dicarboxylate transport system substrate-binding protein
VDEDRLRRREQGMSPTRALRRGVAAALVATLLAACSGGSEGDKAGGDTAPATLRMVTVEDRGAPYADGVEEFARQVGDLSAGSVRVDIVWSGSVEYFGAFGPGSDQKVAGLVQDGNATSPSFLHVRGTSSV